MKSVLAAVLIALVIELLAPVTRIGVPMRGDTIWRPTARVSVYRVKAVVHQHAVQQALPQPAQTMAPRRVAIVVQILVPQVERGLTLPLLVPLRANRPPPVA